VYVVLVTNLATPGSDNPTTLLSGSTPPAIADRFGFANVAEAAFVQKRARSLVDRGFEAGGAVHADPP
jgi:hypothetical protein